MDDSEDVSRDEKFRAGKELFQEYLKKKQTKKKKKRERKPKDDLPRAGSSTDENINSHSSQQVSMDDTSLNLSEEDISDLAHPLEVQSKEGNVEKAAQHLQHGVPTADSEDLPTDTFDGTFQAGEFATAISNEGETLLPVDSGFSAVKSPVDGSYNDSPGIHSEIKVADFKAPWETVEKFSSPDYNDSSVVPSIDSGLETIKSTKHPHVDLPLGNPGLQITDPLSTSVSKDEWLRPVDGHESIASNTDSQSNLQNQIDDLHQQICNLKIAHGNELEGMHKDYAQRMEVYRNQAEEAANSQIQAQYKSLCATLSDQQKQSEAAQAALLASLDKEQSLRRNIEEELEKLREKTIFIEATLGDEKVKNQQLQLANDDLQDKLTLAILNSKENKEELALKWQEEKEEMLKDLEKQAAQARSLSFRDFEDQLQQLTLQLEESQKRESQVLLAFNELKVRADELERYKEESTLKLKDSVQNYQAATTKLTVELQQMQTALSNKEEEMEYLLAIHKEENAALLVKQEALYQASQKQHEDIVTKLQKKEAEIVHSESVWQERLQAEQERTHSLEEQLEELLSCKENMQDLQEVNSSLLSQMESLNQNLGDSESEIMKLTEENQQLLSIRDKLQGEVDIFAQKYEEMESALKELPNVKDHPGNLSHNIQASGPYVGPQPVLAELPAVETLQGQDSYVGSTEGNVVQRVHSVSLKADTALQELLRDAGIEPSNDADVITRLSACVSARSAEIVSMEEKSSALQDVVDNLLKELQEVKAQLEIAKQKTASKEEKPESQTVSIQCSTKTYEELIHDLGSKEAELKQFKTENYYLRLKLSSLEDESGSVKSKLDEIIAGKSGLESELEKERELLSHKLKEKESLELELKKQFSELERKQTEKQMLESLLSEKCKLEEELQSQKDHLLKNLASIQDKLKMQQQELDSREKEWQNERASVQMTLVEKDKQLHRQVKEFESKEEELKRGCTQDITRVRAELDSRHRHDMQELQQVSKAEIEAQKKRLHDKHVKEITDLSNDHARSTEELQKDHTLEIERLNGMIANQDDTIKRLQLTARTEVANKEWLQRQLEGFESKEEELKREFSQDMMRIKTELDSKHLHEMQELQQRSKSEVETQTQMLEDGHKRMMSDLSNKYALSTEKLQKDHALEVERLNGVILEHEDKIGSLQLTIRDINEAENQAATLQKFHEREKESLESVLEAKSHALVEMADENELLVSNLKQEHAKTVRSLMEQVNNLDTQIEATRAQCCTLEDELVEKEAVIDDLRKVAAERRENSLTALNHCEEVLHLNFDMEKPSKTLWLVTEQKRSEPEEELVSRMQQLMILLKEKESILNEKQQLWLQEKVSLQRVAMSTKKVSCEIGVQSDRGLLCYPKESCEELLATVLVDGAISKAKESLVAEIKMKKMLQTSQIVSDQVNSKHDRELTDLEHTLLLEHRRQNELLNQKHVKDLQRALLQQETSLKSAHAKEIYHLQQAAKHELSALANINGDQQQTIEQLQNEISIKEAELVAMQDTMQKERMLYKEEIKRLKNEYSASAKDFQEEIDGKRRAEYESALNAMQMLHQQEKEEMALLHQRNITKLQSDVSNGQARREELQAIISDQQAKLENMRIEAKASVDSIQFSLQAEVAVLQSQLKAEKEKQEKVLCDSEERNQILYQMRGNSSVSNAMHPLLESDEFVVVDAILLQKLVHLAPIMKVEARELSHLADLLNGSNLHEMKCALAELEQIGLSQYARAKEEKESKLSSLVVALQAERSGLLDQLETLRGDLQTTKLDLDRTRELATKADFTHGMDVQVLKAKLDKTTKELDETKALLKQEQSQVKQCKHLISEKDQELQIQEGRINALDRELRLSQSNIKSLSMSLQKSQHDIENANHLLQEYFSGVREAQPIAKAQDHDTQGPIKESLASGAPLATQCLELLHHLRATHDLLEATRGKLASKQIDVKRLQKMYHKSENYRRNLAFQKSYLTQKVDSFFYTQQAAFDILQDMGLVDTVRLHCQSPCVRPKQRFRARVWVVIAHFRIVRLWQKSDKP